MVSLRARTPSRARSSRRAVRPAAEPLESRCLLTAGSLDPTFNLDGKVNTGSSAPQVAEAVAIQPDGKIVVVGYTANAAGNQDFRVVRYNADGSLDNGDILDSTPGDQFGTAFGRVDIGFDFGGSLNDVADAVVIQPDGKIVVAGYVERSNGDVDFAVARLNSDGSLDDGGANDTTPGDSFGSNGKRIIPFNFGGSNFDDASAVAVQPDGKIVVVGSAQDSVSSDSDFGVVRLENDHSFRFASPSAVGVEGGSVTVTVERLGGIAGTASVVVSTGGGNATAGLDYTPVTQLLIFAPGQTAKTVTIPLTADGFAEGTETLQFLLSSPTGAKLASPGSVTVQILDVAPPVQAVTPFVQVFRAKAKRVGGSVVYRQRVTLVNVGPQALAGPLTLVLDGLKKQVKLLKAAGKTQGLAPLGSPYVVLDPGPGPLLPGQARTFVIRFRNPSGKKIAYTPRVLAGVGIP